MQMWAREQECPWDELTCCCATTVSGQLDLLRWATEKGCPGLSSTELSA